ncbi:hypothetical protein DOY81_009460 [Sarcophaga bullata]|nr:hypothetical protein DOY81_009460 [Sarcophaga bullata]
MIGGSRRVSNERVGDDEQLPRPLVADTGYLGRIIALNGCPLCAVIDPIRDYRWHALRCGGPETASFLCEMPVPRLADACNLKDMPNLTPTIYGRYREH